MLDYEIAKFEKRETAWCPGCGNFSILQALQQALTELELDPHDVVLAAGIGQAAKTPQYLTANQFCGLHGRALPAAQAIKIANDRLKVIVNSGDGDLYGEGGNHFLHAIRRNVDICQFTHDNQVYGLTKGQASPTTLEGMVTGVQTEGSKNRALNPVVLALAAGAGFVARSFSGDIPHLKEMMKAAINYRGYALVDIMQPCITFNKLNTFAWYKERAYHIGDDHDPTDLAAAIRRAEEYGDKIPIGILYRRDGEASFHEKRSVLKTGESLGSREHDPQIVRPLLESFI